MAYFRREVGAELALEPFVAKRRHSAYRDGDFDYINEEDSTWLCWCNHVHFVEFASKNSFSWEDIVQMNHLVLQHHSLFNQVYPGEATPKFHWLLHMALDIWWNGPLKHVSCMRFEVPDLTPNHNLNLIR